MSEQLIEVHRILSSSMALCCYILQDIYPSRHPESQYTLEDQIALLFAVAVGLPCCTMQRHVGPQTVRLPPPGPFVLRLLGLGRQHPECRVCATAE